MNKIIKNMILIMGLLNGLPVQAAGNLRGLGIYKAGMSEPIATLYPTDEWTVGYLLDRVQQLSSVGSNLSHIHVNHVNLAAKHRKKPLSDYISGIPKAGATLGNVPFTKITVYMNPSSPTPAHGPSVLAAASDDEDVFYASSSGTLKKSVSADALGKPTEKAKGNVPCPEVVLDAAPVRPHSASSSSSSSFSKEKK